MVTQRDRIWRSGIHLATEYRKFEVRDVLNDVDADPSRKTVQRTLRAMTELEVLRHRHGSPTYSAGSLLRERAGSGHGEPRRGLNFTVDDDAEPELGESELRTEPVDDAGDDDRGDDFRAEVLDALEDRPPHKPAAKEAVATIADHLRREGEASTADLRELAYAEHGGEWANERAMWESLHRYFEEIEFIEDAGYGTWGPGKDD